MRVRPLILNDEVRQQIARVIEYGNSHRYDIGMMNRLSRGMMELPGDDPNRVILIPIGYRVGFTVEQQPFGWSRHVSIYVLDKNPRVAPNPVAVDTILGEFGLPSWKKCTTGWVESPEESGGQPTTVHAVNKL